MAVQKLIARVLIPGGTAIAIPCSFSVQADEGCTGCKDDKQIHLENDHCDDSQHCQVGYETKPVSEMYMSPQDLPIYGGQESEDICTECIQVCAPEDPSQLQQSITKVRQSVMSSVDNLKIEENKDKLLQSIDYGITRIRNAYEHLSREENYLSRAAAISTGGLMGLMMARRGGVIRKVFYASTGMAAAASVCYPKQAVLISDDLYKIGKYYALVTYQKVQEAGTDMSLPSFHAATIDKWRKKNEEKERQLEWARSVGVPLKPPPIKVLLDEQCAGLNIFESDDESDESKGDDASVERVRPRKEEKAKNKQTKLIDEKALPGDIKRKISPKDTPLLEMLIEKPKTTKEKKEMNFYEKVAMASEKGSVIESKKEKKEKKEECKKKEEFVYKPCVRPSLPSIERNFEDMTPAIKKNYEEERKAPKKSEDKNIMPKVSASDGTTEILLNEAEARIFKLKARMKKVAITEANVDEIIKKGEPDLPSFMDPRKNGPKVWSSSENEQTEDDSEDEQTEQSGDDLKQYMVSDSEYDGDTINIWTLDTNKNKTSAKIREARKVVKEEKDEIDIYEQYMKEGRKNSVRETRSSGMKKPFHLAAEEKRSSFTSPKRPIMKTQASDVAYKRGVKKEIKELRKPESTPAILRVLGFNSKRESKRAKSASKVEQNKFVEPKPKPIKTALPSEMVAGAVGSELALAAMAATASGNSPDTETDTQLTEAPKKRKKQVKGKKGSEEEAANEVAEEEASEEDCLSEDDVKAAELAVDFGLHEVTREIAINAPYAKPGKLPGEIPRRVLIPKNLPREFEPVRDEQSFLWEKPDDTEVREEEKQKFEKFIDSIRRNRQPPPAKVEKKMWTEPTKDEVLESEPVKRDKFLTEIFTMGYNPPEPAPPDPDFPHVFTGSKPSGALGLIKAKAAAPPKQPQVQAKGKPEPEYIEYEYYDEYDGDLDDYDYIVITDSRGEVLKPIPKKCDTNRKIPLAAL